MTNLFKEIGSKKNPTLYAQLRAGSLKITNIDSGKAYETAAAALGHPRTLIADFQQFEEMLSAAVSKVTESGRFIRTAPRIVLHPLEVIEGGITPVEVRAMKEAAMNIRATEVLVWLGEELSASNFAERQFSRGSWA